MATSAKIYFGSTLGYNTVAAPTVYTTLAGLRDIDMSGATCGTKDVTAHDSPNAKEFIPLMPDYGEISATLWFNPADEDHEGLMAMVGKSQGWKLALYPSNGGTLIGTYTFDGMVTKVGGMKYGIEDCPEASITIKLSGLPTYA